MPAAPRVWGTSLSLMLQVGIRRKAVPSFVRQGRAATGSGFWPCRRLNAIYSPPGDLRTVRLHNKRAVVGVKDRTVAHGHGRSAAAQLYHRRDAHAAGHDGGMADRAVLVAGQAQHHAAVQTE